VSADEQRPLRVAVVGSGPAGFYAAGALLGREVPVEVDMIERLPTPWGLVRLGVAPDHPKLKSVSRAYERIAERPGFRFLGNVEIGRDLHHSDLARLYDALIYAVGAQSDKRLGIPGEDLPGSWPATEFVAWYNGHPDFQELEFDLDVERAVVIGNGNVAVDVARMLALTNDELAPTDATDKAIAAIGSSKLKEIVMLGRRGPAQAAFTTPELQELGELAGADIFVDPAELELDDVSEASLADITHARRNVEMLREFAGRSPSGKPRALRLRFLVSPVAILGDERVEAIEVEQNRLVPDGRGTLRAEPTGERETIPCGLVFRSVGYRGVALPEVPFDEDRGTIRNEGGRVVDEDGEVVSGRLRRRLDQARPDRGDRHEQEGRDRDRGAAAGGRRGRPHRAARGRDCRGRRRAAGRARRSNRPVRGLELDRPGRAGAGEPHGRPRAKLVTWNELLEAAEAERVPTS